MKKILLVVLAVLLVFTLGGCQLFGGSSINSEPLPIVNGTTAGNILNYGFCAKNGDELIWLYTAGDALPIGCTIRSSPEAEDSEMLMEDGGLYMNIVDGWLYYCKPEGVFKADLEDPQPQLVMEKDIKQLQISGGNMYYIEDGTLNCSTLDGADTNFAPVENADSLNVYGDKLYYINTDDEYIYSADLDGGNIETVLADEASMFIVMDDTLYYIDGITGYLVKKELSGVLAVAIVEEALTGFNINRSNMYYTRYVSGVGMCCNADVDGGNEQQLKEFGDSKWHIVCMYNTGSLLARQEEVE